MQKLLKKLTSIILSLCLALMPVLATGVLAYAENDPEATTKVFVKEPDNPEEEVEVDGLVFVQVQDQEGNAVSGITLKIEFTKTDTLTTVSDSEGKTKFTVPYAKRLDEYAVIAEASDEFLECTLDRVTDVDASSPEAQTPEYAIFKLDERATPTTDDFEIAEAYETNGYIKGAGTYTVTSKEGYLLATSLTDEGEDELSLELNADGTLKEGQTLHYIDGEGEYSKAVASDMPIANTDNEAPVIRSIDTKDLNILLKILQHGIYASECTDIVFEIDVEEPKSGLDKVYVVGSKDGVETRFEAKRVSGTEKQYSAKIQTPELEELMKDETLYVVAIDKLGNETAKSLIRETEEKSQITIENIPPIVDEFKLTGEKGENDWFIGNPTLYVKTHDDQSAIAKIEVKLQGKTIRTATYDERAFTSKEVECEIVIPKVNEEGFSENGRYGLVVEITDYCGNVTTETREVRVDKQAPAVTIDGISDNDFRSDVLYLKVTEDTLYTTEPENLIFVKITKTKDGEEKTILDKTISGQSYYAIDSSLFEEDAVYMITASAKSAAGVKSQEITKSFTKDLTPPTIEIKGVDDGQFYNKDKEVSIEIDDYNYETADYSIKVTKILGQNTKKIDWEWTAESEKQIEKKIFSEDGTYNIVVNAKDNSGNSANAEEITFTIDKTAPVIKFQGVTENEVYGYSDNVAPSIIIDEYYLEAKEVSVERGDVELYSALDKDVSWNGVSFNNFAKDKDNDGQYTIKVKAYDRAGNTSENEIKFVVNRFGSYYRTDDDVAALRDGKAVKAITRDLVIRSYNVDNVIETKNIITLDGHEVKNPATLTEKGGGEDGFKELIHTFKASAFAKEGCYELNVSSTDLSGNYTDCKTENGTIRFYVDRTAPVINVTGLEEKVIKGTDQTVEISAIDTLTKVKVSAKVDNAERRLGKTDKGTYLLTLEEGANQNIVITAEDAAGNVKKYNGLVTVTTSNAIYFLNKYILVILIGLVLAGAATALVIRKTKAEAA